MAKAATTLLLVVQIMLAALIVNHGGPERGHVPGNSVGRVVSFDDVERGHLPG
jgi:hypothetical protein